MIFKKPTSKFFKHSLHDISISKNYIFDRFEENWSSNNHILFDAWKWTIKNISIEKKHANWSNNFENYDRIIVECQLLKDKKDDLLS